jgi:hypothetical protein
MAPPDDLQDEPPLRAGTGTVRAVDRAMQLLLAFAGKPPQKLADLARAADLDKGTARRLLLTLMGTWATPCGCCPAVSWRRSACARLPARF